MKISDGALQMENVSVEVSRKLVLDGLTVQIPAGKLCAIIGPNGAGKSTLIRSILGMQPIQTGSIRLFGQSVQSQKKRIGYVPQKESVDWDFPIDVLDVVMTGTYARLGLFRRPGRAERELAIRCMAELEIADLQHRQVSELSGGQQQRVFLARALAQQADAYFLDEPFVGVDARTEQKMIEILKRLRQQGTSLFVVHHDLPSIPDFFDYVLMLNRTVIAAGPVADVFNPDNLQKTYGGTLHFLGDPSFAVRK